MEYSYDIEVLKKSANDFTEKINLDNCRKFAKELDEKLEALSWRRSTDNLTTHEYKRLDEFEKAGFTGESLEVLRRSAVKMMGQYPYPSFSQAAEMLKDIHRGAFEASNAALLAEKIAKTANPDQSQKPAKFKKKRPQKRKPKPKNRTVYR